MWTQKEKNCVSVKGVITTTHGGLISYIHKGAAADMWASFRRKSFLLELVSNDLTSIKVTAYASHSIFDVVPKDTHIYHCTFDVPDNFGEIGAVLVENEYHSKIFFVSIVLDNGVIFNCDSWVHSKHDNSEPRIFFTNMSYLPLKTPEGLIRIRAKDLESLQGHAKKEETGTAKQIIGKAKRIYEVSTGERKPFDRIYDYDVYNDLGDRPVLGGEEHPYPRRCRTGREVLKNTVHEVRTMSNFYVPIDEDFSETKTIESGLRVLMNLLHTHIPTLESIVTEKHERFPLFRSISNLYDEGVHVPTPDNILRRFVKKIVDTEDTVIQFTSPENINRDTFSWTNDEEFCRQMLAGINPCSIQLVTEWPLKSTLDEKVYGLAKSNITKTHVEEKIKGLMTLEEALANKKLFMLDYHDILLPYVHLTRELERTTLYGSRTLLFLTRDDTLMPIAIELTRPQSNHKRQWSYVYQPSPHATDAWLWKLAKAHVLAHDSAHHQLVSHWLRTHCVAEPYIISTRRNLSQMHPIYRLLFPHFRFTMQINSLARKSLINADGVIESTFSPARYCMELCSDVYDKQWRFDKEALPEDLIRRGMAIKDLNEPYGVKLTIEDYPYANDGLLLWGAIEKWVTSYVNHYYPQAQERVVEDDYELKAWWTEIITVGHEDKKDELWWPKLNTQADLINIVSTIIWVVSGHHAAVNFGQYDFAGYFPNRPTTARTKMPNEDHIIEGVHSEEWKKFLDRPEDVLLECLPSRIQAMKVMSLLNVLSEHSSDEVYLGDKIEPAWAVEPEIQKAWGNFREDLENMVETIKDKNGEYSKFKNRSGAGIVPYELLKPYEKDGDTKKGVPNSVSI